VAATPSVALAAVSAAKPWIGWILIRPVPRVLMTFQPPAAVPSAIAVRAGELDPQRNH
jgi:hypothetical protein